MVTDFKDLRSYFGSIREHDFKHIFSLISLILGVVVAISSIFPGMYSLFTSIYKEDYAYTRVKEEFAINKLKIAELNKKLDDINDHISSISIIPEKDAIYIQVQQLASGVSDLKAREEKIEAVIIDNPLKALEVPLLQRDFENMKISQQASFSAMKDGVDRIYDLNKWLLGAMAVGIVTLAMGNLLKSK